MTPAVESGAYSAGRVRILLLGLVVLGCVGLIAELLLLEHLETFTQWLPLAVLAAALGSALWVAARSQRLPLRVFQGMMLVLLATGAAGVILHYRGNALFEVEMSATIGGAQLVWKALRGAVPVLAPGALVQLGLLGLIYTFGHPALRTPRRPADDPRT